jgi:PAS domain S-box-containing protein
MSQSTRSARARQWLAGSIAIFTLYTGSGWAGILLLRRLMDPTIVAVAPSVALPWLPVGFGVAGLLHYGRGAWPGIFLGSLALWGGIQGDPWQSVVPDAIGETLSIFAIVAMLRSWGFRLALDRYQDSLLLLGALAIGRLIAVGVDAVNVPLMALLFRASDTYPALQAFGVTQTGSTLVIHLDVFAFIGRWWANTVAGGVLVVPLLALLTADPALRRRWPVGLPLLTAAVAVWIVMALGVSVGAWRPALLGVALSIVALAATSFGVGVASATTLVLAMASATGFALRLGMFSGLSQAAQLEVAWGFLALLSGTGLFLTALLAQRVRDRRDIAASVERYRQLFTSNPFPVWAEDPVDGHIRLANPAALRTYGYDEAQFLALRSANLRSHDGSPRSMPGRAQHPLASVECHRTAAGGEIDVEVTRVPIDYGDGSLLTCFVEPLSERIELRLAALTAGDLERFRLGGDLLHRLNPILSHVGHRAEELESRVSHGEPPDGTLLASIAELVGAASGICRRLTRGASALQGADGDLTEAIRRLPSSFVDAEPEIQVSVQSRAPVSLSIERRDHIYRFAEEAVRAAVARAGARNVRVSLDVSRARVRLVVEDDGDPLDTRQSAANLGLRSMSSRAMAAFGQLQIGPAGAGGTAVAVECAQDTEVIGAARLPATAPGNAWTASAAAPVARRADSPAVHHPRARAMLDAALLTAAYVVTGAAGLWLINHLPTPHPSFDTGLALPWLANGVGVVGLLLRGERLWPAVFIASVALWRGVAADPWITVLCDAVGESVAAIVTVRLLRRWDFHLACDRFRDVALLAAAAAAGRSVVFFADTAGIYIAALVTPLAFAPNMHTAHVPEATLFGISTKVIAAGGRWWLNGVAGVVLAVPALGSWSGRQWAELRVRPAELTGWLAALGAAALAILIAPQAGWRLSTLAVGLVIVTWGAVRFGVTLASVATLLLSLAATTGFIVQIGPLAPTGPGEGIGVLWGYIALLGATALFVATTLAEHNQDLERLERNSRRYRALFDAVPHPVFAYETVGGRIRLANRAATLRYGLAPSDIGHLGIADLDCDERLPPAPRPDTIGPMSYMARHRTRTGDAFDVELALTVLDIDGSPGALCFAIDVSERNRLRSRVLEATDRERRHLARDLHDGLGQVLTGLQLGVSALKRTVERGEPIAAKSVAFVAEAAREAQRTADRVLRGISPLQDTNGDLLQAIRNLADHLPPAYRSQLKVSVSASASVMLPLEQREHLYQIVREAVTNAMKHARATEIAVTICVTPSEIEARVEDDGVGFEPDARLSGIGLESLSLRAGVLRGQLAMAPRTGRGTVVRCRCPQPFSPA